MTTRCPVCGKVCVYEEDDMWRHINSSSECKDFANIAKKEDEK